MYRLSFKRSFVVILPVLCLVTGCASGPPPAEAPVAAAAAPKAAPEQEAPVPAGPKGTIQIDVTDVAGFEVPAKVVFRPKTAESGAVTSVDLPQGRAEAQVPVGQYTAFVYVSAQGPMELVEAQDVEIKEGSAAFLPVNILEGASGNLPVQAFDKDMDGALDRVELARGTDPANPCSVPGQEPVAFPNTVLAKEAGWYRGELHAHSVHGAGSETVTQLVRRAEGMGLDFLAIADRGTMAAAADPEFKSSSVVLLPAMEWGNEKQGLALIYGPRTLPEPATCPAEAQTVSNRVQVQGGIFAIAQPCFSSSPWQWGTADANAIEVWVRQWRQAPPMAPDLLSEDWTERYEGKLIHSIGIAAATGGMSANAQAAVYWDEELKRGLKACAIGGSGTGSPSVPMASPVTYVYALEKSAAGILAGLRCGRTFVSSGLDGPKLRFVADVLKDGKIDVNIGGVAPTGVDIQFEAGVDNAKGKKLQVMCNGSPIMTKIIESDSFIHRFDQKPEDYSVYWIRVIDTPKEEGFGMSDVLALSSPIYADDIAQDILLKHPEVEPGKAWIDVKRDPNEPEEMFVPPPPEMTREIKPQWEY